MPNHNHKLSGSDVVLKIIAYVFIAFFAIVCVMPFILVVASSFTDEVTLVKYGYNLWPKEFSITAYKLIAETNDIFNAYGVTVFITVVGTILSLTFTCFIAYAMSVVRFKSRNYLAFFLYFTMLFNGGLVANYLLISKYLGMKNTIWVLILPSMLSAYNIMLMRNFFKGIPDSFAESAKIDGASELRILFQIILPLSQSGLATIGLFYALGYWNEWYKVLLYIDDTSLHTLQYFIMKILRQINYASTLPDTVILPGETLPTYGFRMAAVTVTIGPIVFLYPFLQKYFVTGLTIGGVKG